VKRRHDYRTCTALLTPGFSLAFKFLHAFRGDEHQRHAVPRRNHGRIFHSIQAFHLPAQGADDGFDFKAQSGIASRPL